MNTSNYEYLLTLEKTGTISETARRFYVSPSAISQCLKNAEKQLGYPLFYREDRPEKEAFFCGAHARSWIAGKKHMKS